MKRLSLIIIFTILSTAFAVFPPIQEYSEEIAFTEDDVEASSTTETTIIVSDKQPIESDDFTKKSEPPGDMIEIRQSRSPLISVYLRKIKQNPRLPTNNSTANKSEVAEEILITPIKELKSEVLKSTGSRDEISRPNYALIMSPQYYGSTRIEENLLKEEEDKKMLYLSELSSPPRKLFVPQRMRPYPRPQLNYASYFGPRPYGYPSGYGMQTGYTPQRFTNYPPQSGYVRPDYGYRLGNGPDMEENPDEEEDNKFFNLSELLSPPRKPYVPGSIRPYSSSRPNYANFLGPNWRLNYGQPSDQYVSSPYPYYSGYSGN